jgi:hypothetical protein
LYSENSTNNSKDIESIQIYLKSCIATFCKKKKQASLISLQYRPYYVGEDQRRDHHVPHIHIEEMPEAFIKRHVLHLQKDKQTTNGKRWARARKHKVPQSTQNAPSD